jgi:hypothetical protein
MGFLCNIWSTTAIQWSKYNLTWSECQFIQDIIVNPGGVDAEMLIQPWNPYQTGSLDKRKKLIKLICKINGREYPQEREVKNFKITIGDIKTMIKTVTDVDLDFKMEE